MPLGAHRRPEKRLWGSARAKYAGGGVNAPTGLLGAFVT